MRKPQASPESTDTGAVEESGGAARRLTRRKFVSAAAGTVAATLLGVPARSDTKSSAPTRQYRIHPAIGVARVGNADPGSYFIGPEIPGLGIQGGAPGSSAWPRKVNGLVKPQAARFRVFE